MDGIAAYASDDDGNDSVVHTDPSSPATAATESHDNDDSNRTLPSAFDLLPTVNSAPQVAIDSLAIRATETAQLRAVDGSQWHVNLPIEATLAPYQGPRDGSMLHQVTGGGKRVVTGVIERANMDDLSFDAQYHTYNLQHAGERRNRQIPSEDTQRGDLLARDAESVLTMSKIEGKKKSKTKTKNEESKTFAEEFGDATTDGIWAPYQDRSKVEEVEEMMLTEEQRKRREARVEAKKRKAEDAEVDEDVAFDRLVERKMAHLLPARLRAGQQAMVARTEFVGDQEYDYQGRSWVEAPKTLKPDDGEHDVFLPKKCIHKFVGHSKGVQALALFPQYGHLALSGSLDHTVRIWDVYNERKCKRVYEGHTAGVRALDMSNDGRQFLTASFDRFMQLWDTETGQAVHSFTNRRVPYCIKFYPDDNSQFVIGDSNNMIVQFDARSGEVVQEYNHHLQAVNSVTFVDSNKRFVSTSDDKKILIWEWGIPVPVKYISEPGMHSMPTVALHPSGAFFAGQSLNNQIDVYTARDKFKLCRKKIFKGHSNAGYACPLTFSPNGQYLLAGDGEGKWCVWDWKSTKLYKKMRAHDRGPCMGVAWHPIEPSQVLTCGWDGVIKLWD